MDDGGGLGRWGCLVAVVGEEFRRDFVLGEGFEAGDAGYDGFGHLLAVGRGGDLAGLGVAGDEATLDKDGGDLGETDHCETGVFYPAIHLGDVAEERVVDALGEG